METSLGQVEGDKGLAEGNAVCSNELGLCRCSEREEERKKFEMRCTELETEIKKKIDECEALETRNKTLEAEKSTIEAELEVLKRKIGGIMGHELCLEPKTRTKSIVGFRENEDEEDEVFRLNAENVVLECEKKQAESQAEDWKNKYKKLQSLLLQSDMSPEVKKDFTLDREVNIDPGLSEINGVSNMHELGTPPNYTECKKISCLNSGVRYGQNVRKHLKFEEQTPRKKNMAPSTPSSRKPTYLGAVYVIDDDEPNDTTTVHLPTPHDMDDRNGCISKYSARERSGSSVNQCKDDEDMDLFEEKFPHIGALKRKKTQNVFISDSDTDDDDIPISKLKKKHHKQETSNQVHVDLKSFLMADISSTDTVVNDPQPPARRRLIPLRNCVRKDQENEKLSAPKANKEGSSPIDEDFEDNKIEDSSSESEGDSLREFIVLSDASDNKDPSRHDDASSSPGEVSDEENFTAILSKIRREKNYKMEWEFEGEMLAAFARDPKLCMKAVCALYRQQTLDEKISKETLYYNGRGFSKFDAQRGCKVAEFLTNGDQQGELQKSVEELQEFDSRGVELCRTLATHYSKQLFAIYQSKEDPLFLP